MADLYNGFIYSELGIKLRVAKTHAASSALGSGATNIANNHSVWVGFIDAAQAIAQYQILANVTPSTTKKTQSQSSTSQHAAMWTLLRRQMFSHVHVTRMYDRRLTLSELA